MQSFTRVLLGFFRRCWHTYRWLSIGMLCILLVGTSGGLYAVMASRAARSLAAPQHDPATAVSPSSPAIRTSTPTGTPTATSPMATSTSSAAPQATAPTTGVPEAPTPPQGARLVYDDEFDGSSMNPAWVAWNRPGDSSNSEIECYTPGNVAVSGGYLALTAKVDASSSCAGYAYTSGGTQWGEKSFTYGTFEYRAKFTGGTGTWPAIWLLGAKCQADQITDSGNNCNWPNPGSEEIDITEVTNGFTNTPKQNYFSGNSSHFCMPSASDVSQNWHTYDLVWQPGSLVWKIDGAVTCTVTTLVPSTPMFPIINVALGGTGGGTVDNSTLPQTMFVDYVRLYQ